MATGLVARQKSMAIGEALGTGALAMASGLIVGLSLTVLIAGAPYYILGDAAREAHWLHPLLRSGGLVGLWLGVGGAALMAGILVYRVRKLIPGANWMGSMTWWLRFHLMCGILGPVLIFLHAGLQLPHGFIAVGFWCMIAVALSGVFGRFVFGHLPKGAAGRELELGAALKQLSALRAQLVEQTQGEGGSESLGEAVILARDFEGRPNNIFGLIRLDAEVRRRQRAIGSLMANTGLPEAQRREVTTLLVNQLVLKRNLEAWEVSTRLFRYWHLFHRPLATAMYLLVALHVLNAILLGGAIQTLLMLEG